MGGVGEGEGEGAGGGRGESKALKEMQSLVFLTQNLPGFHQH